MRKALKVFSVLYWIACGFFALFAILTFASGDLLNAMKDAFPVNFQGADPKIVFGIVFLIYAIVYALIAIGLRRVANNKSKGTFLLVVLCISAIYGIYTVITAFSISNLLSLAVALLMVYLVYSVRKENN